MKKQVTAEEAPAAIGPYSHAIFINNLLFLSGQLPVDPECGEIMSNDFKEQTMQAMENIKTILNELNMIFEDLIKVTIYTTNLEKIDVINDAYGKYFSNIPPARSCVEVNKLPKGALIEIEAIACRE